MKAAAKIILGLGAAAATVALASHSRHRAAIRGTTLLMTGAARAIDWKAARQWIERGAQLIIYTRSAADLEQALRELRQLGPSAQVRVDRSGNVVATGASPATASAGVGGLVGTIATVASIAKWLWPVLDRARSRTLDQPPLSDAIDDSFASPQQTSGERPDVRARRSPGE